MISIKSVPLDINNVINKYEKNSIEQKTLEVMNSSRERYNYNSLEELDFDLRLKSATVEAAREMDDNDLSFKVFNKAKCNSKYWKLMNDGGFLLREGVEPYVAVNDIFDNSDKYGTECATAIIIIYYRALTKVLSREKFNAMYPSILLMNWQDIDERLAVNYYDDIEDNIPGYCRYFKNPDVNPKYPEWQGENVIDLGDGTYFGHGLGIDSGEGIIKQLNKKRRKGAQTSAYLLDTANFQNGKYLYRLQNSINL